MNKNQKKLLSYLRSQHLMSLSTQGKHLWTCTVYFVVDDEFNFYFVSPPDSLHCRQIQKNPQVAFNIADSRQKVTEKKVGVQARGQAKKLTKAEKTKQVLKMWNQANPGYESVINWENMQTGKIKSKIFQIKPSFIKFFSEPLFGPEGHRLFDFPEA